MVLMTVLLAISFCVPVKASEKTSRVLRVAFPQVQGISETAGDGTRYGLVVDYLNEIAKYTNWEYEYIDVDSSDELLERFDQGEFDLMGGSYYMSGLEDYYGYPDYNMGYSRSALLARDGSIRINDLESMNGKCIGVYVNAKEAIRRLKEFLSINNLDCRIKEYSYEQLSAAGNLYAYLANGEIDLLLGNCTERGTDFRIVATYDSQPN